MPPDFWDSDPVADIDAQPAKQNEPRPDEVTFAGSSRPPEPSQPRQPKQEVIGKLTDDPRFAVMQSLFPGQIVEWQDNEDEVSEEGADEPGADDPGADDPDKEVDGLN